jgi:DNA-binding MarR family transcriptional regulator
MAATMTRYLATLLHYDKTNITGLVTRLETRHLVRRQPNREDRRVTQVVLTAEGATVMTHFRDAVTAAVAGPLGVLAGRRRAELVELARAAAERLR